ncbi:MAG: metallophosphoesterase [Capsulimonadaceae bacterium]|nr:metallophosphoesterase [Capsulimonadaceae bacterium]
MPIGYDIVGDLHGHLNVLGQLCSRLGYEHLLMPPPDRRIVFTGDLSTRGPHNLQSLLAVRDAVMDGRALAVLGNHDDALLRWLRKDKDSARPKLAGIIAEIDSAHNPERLKKDLKAFLESLPLVLRLDEDRLLVVHGAIEDRMVDHPITAADRKFLLNGDAIGKTPEGRTLRRDWALAYSAAPFVVYGHTPVEHPAIRYNTIDVDTGVYVTGRLTAFRWPEREIVTVQA